MSTVVAQELTLADVLQQLGGISPRRIRFRPAPGTATEDDVIKIHDRERRLFELVEGVLVEKVWGIGSRSWRSSWRVSWETSSSAGNSAHSPAKGECSGCRPALCGFPTCRSFRALDWRTIAATAIQFFLSLPILRLKY